MDALSVRRTGQSRRLPRAASCVTRAFTMVEIMIVVIVVGILAAIVVPQFGGVTEDAKAAALQGSLGGVRSAIAGYRAKQVLGGGVPFPTRAQLTTLNTVVQGEFPTNPFNSRATVQAVTRAQATARRVVGTAAGWNYYVDNTATPPTAIFYANSSVVTNVSNGSGGFRTANQL